MITGKDFIDYIDEERMFSEILEEEEQRMFDDNNKGLGFAGTAALTAGAGLATLGGGFAAAKRGMLGNNLRRDANKLWAKAGNVVGSNSMMRSGIKGQAIADANLKTGKDLTKGVKTTNEWNNAYQSSLDKYSKDLGLTTHTENVNAAKAAREAAAKKKAAEDAKFASKNNSGNVAGGGAAGAGGGAGTLGNSTAALQPQNFTPKFTPNLKYGVKDEVAKELESLSKVSKPTAEQQKRLSELRNLANTQAAEASESLSKEFNSLIGKGKNITPEERKRLNEITDLVKTRGMEGSFGNMGEYMHNFNQSTKAVVNPGKVKSMVDYGGLRFNERFGQLSEEQQKNVYDKVMGLGLSKNKLKKVLNSGYYGKERFFSDYCHYKYR